MGNPLDNGNVVVSKNGRFLQHENGEPFPWMGDTGWLLFSRLTREEAERYLEQRRGLGYNVIQVMVIHSESTANVYGHQPFFDADVTRPKLTGTQDGFWEHAEYIVGKAVEKGLYLALVPLWGSVVAKRKAIDAEKAERFGNWLAERFKRWPNIFWLIGGDKRGSERIDVWQHLAGSIRKVDTSKLMTFHPFGRTQSSTWFHHENWLDFNMFQSGHRRYDQVGGESPATWKGEDNWRYVQEDYAREPAKPTLDGEPSYEGIPQGLHDPKEPFWDADDCRRYAYWSVFAGAFGHTYGHSAVMQMHKPEYVKGSYGVKEFWEEALHAGGARQVPHLKRLLLSRPYFDRIPDQTLIHGDPGYRYDRLIATRGKDYLFAYIYTGRPFELRMGHISGTQVKAWWFDPRTGESRWIGLLDNSGIAAFTPPGERRDGNDWVLVLDDASRDFPPPGRAE